jgi:hypothetical protein
MPFVQDLLQLTIVMVLICSVVASAEVNSSSSTHGTKWTDYTDPYARYTIKYPSKWSIQSEPVHSTISYLLEVPLKVSNSHGSTLMISEIKNEVGLNLREFTSFVRNNDYMAALPKRTVLPITCGVISQPGVDHCEYYQTYTNGFTELGDKVLLFSDSSKRVFHVEFLFSPDEPLNFQNINYMLGSFKVLGQSNNKETTETTKVPDYKIPDFYASPTLGIKIWYPRDWQVIEGTGVSFLSRVENKQDTFREAIRISASSSQGKSLSEIINGVVNYYKTTLSNFNLIKSDSNVTVANNPAHRLTYTFSDKVGGMRAIDIGIEKGESNYIIQYIAQENHFDNYMPLVQKMIDSFEIIK